MLGGELPTGTVSSAADHRPRPRGANRPTRTTEPADGGRPSRRIQSTDGGGSDPTRPGDPAPHETTGEGGDDQHRSRAQLRAEIERLEHELANREQQEQRVIDRYERLLAKQRQRADNAERSSGAADGVARLQRATRQLLQAIGVR